MLYQLSYVRSTGSKIPQSALKSGPAAADEKPRGRLAIPGGSRSFRGASAVLPPPF
jgi:hypothetical protein